MHNRIIIGNMIFEKESDETIVIKTHDRDGKPIAIQLTMQQALEASHALTGWVCGAWIS